MSKGLLYTLFILLSSAAAVSSQETLPDVPQSPRVVIQTTTSDGKKTETRVEVLSGTDATLQVRIDSLMMMQDSSTGTVTKVNIFRIPGDKAGQVDIFGPEELEEIGKIFESGDLMKWIEMEDYKALSEMKFMSEKPFLGVIIDTDHVLERGLEIMNVVGKSAAEEAGLKKDDILLSVNGIEINNLRDLGDVLAETRVKDEVTLRYSRDGLENEATAILKSRAESQYDLAATFDVAMPDCCKSGECAHHKGQRFTALMHKQRPVLGVYIENLDEEMIADLRVDGGQGVLVTKVIDQSPAHEMGIKINDVLVSLDGRDIRDVAGLHELLAQLKSGVPVEFHLIRYGMVKTVRGQLAAGGKGSPIDENLFFEHAPE